MDPHPARSPRYQSHLSFTMNGNSGTGSTPRQFHSTSLPYLPQEPQVGTSTKVLDQQSSVTPENGSDKDTETAVDMEQHCLLFPTYATRHSRSGSKDPLDWNIRVRGWAFSKRSNRRKRLVMSMARKLAGVTKDNKVYETLESRFGMFLASNTQDALFSIQCIGAANTTHMELAGDPNSQDPTVDVLRQEYKSPDAAIIAAEAADDRAKVRKSLEETGDRPRAVAREHEQHQQLHYSRGGQPRVIPNSSASGSMPVGAGSTPLTKVNSPEEQSEPSFSDRWNKSAAFVKGAYRKYKPMVMAQIGNNSSVESLQDPPYVNHKDYTANADFHGSEYRSTSSDKLPSTLRTDTGDSIISQTETHYENLGHGVFPTVQVSSRPGGHFECTLRVSHENVQAHRRQLDAQGEGQEGHHPRFLKLHAYHPDMTEPCHGIVNLIDPSGISVISDIDDTIKETNIAAGARIILRNTFLKDMQDVPGMAHVYKQWWKQGASIHYVSNSPWQLIPSLLEFFHSYKFPPGSAHLRLHDSVLKTYFMTPGENKRRAIQEILTDFPERKFILVGDSGEIDMEIYTEMAVAFPKQVFRIFIRDISTARLQELVSRLELTPQGSRSFSSLIPKAPMNAVVSGLGYFTKQGSAASSASNVATNVHSQVEEEMIVQTGDNSNIRDTTPTSTLEESTRPQFPTKGPRGGTPEPKSEKGVTGVDKVESPLKPPRLGRRRSKTLPSVSTSTVDSASIGTPPSSTSQAPMMTSFEVFTPMEATLEPIPGGIPPPSTTPPLSSVKNPLEIWLDRVEECRKKLPEGMLTFFTDAGVLEHCAVVQDMFRRQENTERHP